MVMHGIFHFRFSFFLVLFLFHFALQAQKSPFGFLENKGQILDQSGIPNSKAIYLLSTGNGLNVQLLKEGFSYEAYVAEGTPATVQRRIHRVDITFDGANPSARIEAQDMAADYLLYYGEEDRKAGIRVRHFRKIVYREIYPHIDVEFVAWPDAQKPVEYNFVLKPGARLSDIRLSYAGASKAEATPEKIHLALSFGNLCEYIPASYWQDNRQPLAIRYLSAKQASVHEGVLSVGFQGIDGVIDRPLVIDPTPHLDWGTYYGGGDLDEGRGMALDRQGNAYAIGRTQSAGNIATAGVHQSTLAAGTDALIVKFNPDGVRVWGAYYGGTGNESGQAIEVDAQGNVYAVGATESSTGIASPGAFQTLYNSGNSDAFLVKFRPDGTRIWGTYFGGPAYEFCNDLAIDASGNIFITGWTISSTGIATPGTHQPVYSDRLDGFVAKFNAGGARLWSTYFGDTGFDLGLSAVTDASGNVLVSGWTSSTSNIATAGAFQTAYGGGEADAFILKFAGANGALQWGTYYGGANNEYGDGFASDAAGNLYMTGPVNSGNAHSTAGTHQPALRGVWDAFVAKFNPSGVRLWGTYFGGDGDESGYGIKADPTGSGAVFVSGFTNSANGISTAAAHQTAYGGGPNDAFLAKFSSSGILEWGSYYGGSAEDRGYGIDVDSALVTYLVGWTASASGIANAKGHQPAFGGGTSDMLVARFSDCYAPPAPVNATDSTSLEFCSAANTVLRARGEGFLSWYDAPAGGMLLATGDSLAVSALVNTRTYYVQDSVCAVSTGRTPITVTILPGPIANAGPDLSVCSGKGATLNGSASGGKPPYQYAWSTGANAAVVPISPATNATIFLTVTDDNGCSGADQVSVSVVVNPTVNAGNDQIICEGTTAVLTATPGGGTAPYRYAWTTGDSLASISVAPRASLAYNIVLTDSNNCSASDEVQIQVTPRPVASIQGSGRICLGNSATLTASGGSAYLWNTGSTASSISVSPGVSSVYEVVVSNQPDCSDTASISIEVLPLPSVSLPDQITLRQGERRQLDAESGADTYQWAPSAGLSCTDCPDPVLQPLTGETYCVTATKDGCSSEACIVVEVSDECPVFVPNAFSPNGDQVNDLFCPYSNCLQEFTMEVFSRWGALMFSGTGTEACWDGKQGGHDQNSGVYVYKIQGTTLNGKKVNLAGEFFLLR